MWLCCKKLRKLNTRLNAAAYVYKLVTKPQSVYFVCLVSIRSVSLKVNLCAFLYIFCCSLCLVVSTRLVVEMTRVEWDDKPLTCSYVILLQISFLKIFTLCFYVFMCIYVQFCCISVY